MAERPDEVAEIVRRLDVLEAGDIEGAHAMADAILLDAVHPDVREAYNRVIERAGDWWYA